MDLVVYRRLKNAKMRYTKVIPIFLSLVFVFSSCKDERPDGVLSQEQMVALLMDIYVAEGNMTELRLERDSVLKIFKVYILNVLVASKIWRR